MVKAQFPSHVIKFNCIRFITNFLRQVNHLKHALKADHRSAEFHRCGGQALQRGVKHAKVGAKRHYGANGEIACNDLITPKAINKRGPYCA